ncbi:hypothetical protein D8I35_05355 [Corticibacter populi]|uniref:Uncharacterized protein n=1 Tax=Corticibacter populi TaxID=1550736 RepID=A0A3M6QZX0_9BURK|nr:hypothetical protein [Corticibacter populi]RMX08505.1 hypothetical protein D8I35_05355 [Corticibacter populi]RZS35817.1 hypothetical protein EV687_0896 [Corticibacter populi]
MATITKTIKDAGVSLGSTPWGNLSALRYLLATNAAGAVLNSDSTAAAAQGDVIRIGILPAGFRFVDSQVLVKVGLTASVTGKLGFAYVDGKDDTAAPQDDDYFGTGLVLSAAARLRNATANGTVVLKKDAYLTLTLAGADNAKASEVEVVIFGIAEGVN